MINIRDVRLFNLLEINALYHYSADYCKDNIPGKDKVLSFYYLYLNRRKRRKIVEDG